MFIFVYLLFLFVMMKISFGMLKDLMLLFRIFLIKVFIMLYIWFSCKLIFVFWIEFLFKDVNDLYDWFCLFVLYFF